MNFILKHRFVFLVLLLLIGINALVYVVDPEQIIAAVGLQNAYIITFVLAAVGGVSVVTSSSIYAAIVTFAAGGAHPLILGLVGGIGLFVSDSIFYYIAQHVRNTVHTQHMRWLHKIEQAALNASPVALLAGIYVYSGLTPFPGDLLIAALVLAGVRYRFAAPAILAGAITLSTLVAYFGHLFL